MTATEGNLTEGNLFADLPERPGERLAEEQVDILAAAAGLRIERIVSTGQATPPGQWYDQAQDEWVALLRGSAALHFEGEAVARPLAPGDWVHIPAHVRHRVAATAADRPTVWLAIHFNAD